MDTGGIIALSLVGLAVGALIVVYIAARLKGSLEIIFQDRTYVAGETLQGRVMVNCHKPIDAENLTVTLTCKSGNGKNTSTLYTERKELFGIRQISPGNEVNAWFSFAIPESIDPTGGMELPDISLMGISVKDLVHASTNLSHARWSVMATLSATGLDLHRSRGVHVNISGGKDLQSS